MEKLKVPILVIPDIVFYPNTSIPIIIEDKNCINMVKDCIKEGAHLGLTMAEPTQSFNGELKYIPQRVGTLAKPVVIEELEGGILKIIVRGIARISLDRVEQNIPYPIYEISVLPDIRGPEFSLLENGNIERLKNIIEYWAEENINDSIERENFLDNLTGLHSMIDYLCMFLIRDHQMRQCLLENRQLSERIQILNTLLQGQLPTHEDPFSLQAVKEFEHIEHAYKVAH